MAETKRQQEALRRTIAALGGGQPGALVGAPTAAALPQRLSEQFASFGNFLASIKEARAAEETQRTGRESKGPSIARLAADPRIVDAYYAQLEGKVAPAIIEQRKARAQQRKERRALLPPDMISPCTSEAAQAGPQACRLANARCNWQKGNNQCRLNPGGREALGLPVRAKNLSGCRRLSPEQCRANLRNCNISRRRPVCWGNPGSVERVTREPQSIMVGADGYNSSYDGGLYDSTYDTSYGSNTGTTSDLSDSTFGASNTSYSRQRGAGLYDGTFGAYDSSYGRQRGGSSGLYDSTFGAYDTGYGSGTGTRRRGATSGLYDTSYGAGSSSLYGTGARRARRGSY